MGPAVSGDPSHAGYMFNKKSGAEDTGFPDTYMDRLLLLSHPPCDTCELQGNDSPGFGMRKCRGFTHPVLLLISSSADSCCSCSIVTRYYKSFSQFPVLVSPVFPVHMFSFPSHSLLLRFNSLSFGISLSARS